MLAVGCLPLFVLSLSVRALVWCRCGGGVVCALTSFLSVAWCVAVGCGLYLFSLGAAWCVLTSFRYTYRYVYRVHIVMCIVMYIGICIVLLSSMYRYVYRYLYRFYYRLSYRLSYLLV